MLRLPLWVLQVIGALLVLNPPITALIGFDRYTNVIFATLALHIYVIAALISVFYYRTRRMPAPLAWINLLVVVTVPQLIHASVAVTGVDSQSSWYVSGLGALLAVTAIRGHQIVSWIGTAVLSVLVLVWGGIGAMFNSGLAGSFALVAGANALSYALARFEIETKSYLEKTIQLEAASAIESSTRLERSRRLAETLRVSYPLLSKISHGRIDNDTRLEARLVEAQLRDGIRGRDLIDENLRISIRSARVRGIEVTVLDEGGLSSLTEDVKSEIRKTLASELDQVSSGRVTIRAPRGSSARATFVASRPGTATPDVFLKL